MSLLTRARGASLSDAVQIYEPHKVGLPPLVPYFNALWGRRQFAFEMSRTALRAQHFNTAFGMLWLVLNPLLLGLVYALLVFIIGGRRAAGESGLDVLAHLLGALFAYTLFQQSVTDGANSVIRGGQLLLNSSFPRALLPISAVMTDFMKFAPTMVVYAAIHVAAGVETNANLLWAVPVLALLLMFTMGAAMLFATLQVYFRDIRNFLPYLLRIGLYLAPVLWRLEQIDKLDPWQERIVEFSPMYDLIGSWSLALQGDRPPTHMLLQAAAWAVASLVIGSLVFVSREREFAVRL
jgi:ABC-type polysaccharide/polyol phosphate export permease